MTTDTSDELLPRGAVRLGFDKYGRRSLTRYRTSSVVRDEAPADPPTPPAIPPATWQSRPRLDRSRRRELELFVDTPTAA